MRTIEFWKTKLAEVEKEVQGITIRLDKTKVDVDRRIAPQSPFVPMRTLWLRWVWHVRTRRRLKARREMLLRKIAYYKERIEARGKRTAFDAVRRPVV